MNPVMTAVPLPDDPYTVYFPVRPADGSSPDV